MGRTTEPVQRVRAASTAQVTLSGLQTVDGIALNHGETVMIKDQLPDEDNGIYVVNADGAWPRHPGADHHNNFYPGLRYYVMEGTINAGFDFILVADDPFEVGVTAPTFTLDDITHPASSGASHSDVVLNNTHRTGDGSDHADVAANTLELTYQPRASDPKVNYESFSDGTGNALKTPWVSGTDGGAAAAPTLDFGHEPFSNGCYQLISGNALENPIPQRIFLYWNDDIRIVPVSAVIGGTFVCDFAFRWVPAGAQGAANTIFTAGLANTRNVNLYGITRYLRVTVSGTNMDLLIEGEDGTTTTSTDTGYNISRDVYTRIKIIVPQSGASQGVATFLLATHSSSWLTLGTVDVSQFSAVDYMQPHFEVQKEAAVIETLNVCNFSAFRRLPH
jgi:hypothetical protein